MIATTSVTAAAAAVAWHVVCQLLPVDDLRESYSTVCGGVLRRYDSRLEAAVTGSPSRFFGLCGRPIGKSWLLFGLAAEEFRG